MAESHDFTVPLADPQDAAVDIVFVHGTGGDARKTWSINNVFWPRDLLPSSIDNARILSWDYDADFLSFWPQRDSDGTIIDHARRLLFDIAGMRVGLRTPSVPGRKDLPSRPIMLVAHSLGGLICAQALVYAQGRKDSLGRVAQDIRGIVFLATPLRGSDKGIWVERARKFHSLLGSGKSDVPKHFERGSARLIELVEQFASSLKARDNTKTEVQVLCMFETEDTGSLGRIVDRGSACLDSALSLPALGDHRRMCKFENAQAKGYRTIANTLRMWLEDLAHPNATDTETTYNFFGSNFGENNTNSGTQIGNAVGFGPTPAVTTTSSYYYDGRRPSNDDRGRSSRSYYGLLGCHAHIAGHSCLGC